MHLETKQFIWIREFPKRLTNLPWTGVAEFHPESLVSPLGPELVCKSAVLYTNTASDQVSYFEKKMQLSKLKLFNLSDAVVNIKQTNQCINC